MATQSAVDDPRAAEFMIRVVNDCSGAMVALLCELGDRLGLFRDLAENGPATSEELAQRVGLNERYVREWLRGVHAAQYVEYDTEKRIYSLPEHHAPALAEEAGPLFIAPGFRMLAPLVAHVDAVADAFVNGGGVPQSAYDERWWSNMQRFTASWYEHHLVQEWVPSVPQAKAKLEDGAAAADVGCGGGRAVIKLAHAFPNSRFVGYDVVPEQIEIARSNAAEAGVEDRAKFEVLEVADGLPEKFDLVTTFDAVHEAVDPLAVFRAVREALKDDGTWLLSEMNCADRHEENVSPMHALFYGLSIFYCMTTVMSHGGEGLGTCGLPEAKVRELAREAGFSEVRRLEPTSEGGLNVASVENILYAVEP
jgi:2-polyprenyl-3-methyl-5-hydroxy-6-metoxy-1,4-benzoquinol methylase